MFKSIMTLDVKNTEPEETLFDIVIIISISPPFTIRSCFSLIGKTGDHNEQSDPMLAKSAVYVQK